MTRFPYPLVGGFLFSAGSMPLLIGLARRLGIVDNPAHRKTHSQPTPYLGGLGIVLGFVLGPGIYYYLFPERALPGDWERYSVIIGPVLAACVLGLIDDKRPVRARIKLFVQFAIAFSFVYFGFKIEIIEFPGLRGYGLFEVESIPFTMLWMLGVINGVNLIDGVDGLAGGVSAVIFATIALLAMCLDDPDWLVAAIALSALGGTLGFLIYNWRPAKIYMGDAGSLALGTLIATLLVALGQHKLGGLVVENDGETIIAPYQYQFAKITLIAFYPMMEISLSILRRLLSGKPIGSADKGHVHHRLIRWGWGAPTVCFAAMMLSGIAGLTVVFVQLRLHGVASWLLLTGGVMFVLLLHASGFLEIFRPQAIRGNRPHFLIANHFISMQRIKLGLAQNIGEIAALAEQTCIEFGVEKHSMRLTSGVPDAPPFELEWNKPAMVRGSILLATHGQDDAVPVAAFSDKVAIASGSRAEWSFEPHVVEEEIDIEYRVLMSDFMRKALECAEDLYRQRPVEPVSSDEHVESSTSVRSSELRRRKRNSEKFTPRHSISGRSISPGAAHGE